MVRRVYLYKTCELNSIIFHTRRNEVIRQLQIVVQLKRVIKY